MGRNGGLETLMVVSVVKKGDLMDMGYQRRISLMHVCA